MKRKTIYAALLICCLGLISSANPNTADGNRKKMCFSEKGNCCGTSTAGATKKIKAPLPATLNLFLFDL